MEKLCFSSYAGEGLLIPAEAIIFSGKRTVVCVKASDGMFEGRDVKIGKKYGSKYQVLEGLEKDEEVASHRRFPYRFRKSIKIRFAVRSPAWRNKNA